MYGYFEPEYKQIQTDIKTPIGFYSHPILAVLKSLRVYVHNNSLSDDYKEEEIGLLINLINHIRSDIDKNIGIEGTSPAISYYFADTSSNLEFANNRDLYTEASLKSRNIEKPKELINAIKFTDKGLITDDYPDNPYVLQLKQERQFLDILIILAAANNAAPIIKVPISNNSIYTQIRNLASVDRQNGRKTNAMMKKLKDHISPKLDEWLEYIDASPSSPIKFVSNLPLEWGFHQGIPLMVRHEVNRIPITPGYVAARILLDPHNINISTEDLHEILFISSFADNDPIRNHLKDSLEAIHSLGSDDKKLEEEYERLKEQGLLPKDYQIPENFQKINVHIKWIEVANKTELVNAINNNPCAITVFDLHGSHSENGGLLHLKNETVSVFDIYEDIRISPIVILSSCDTSPVDKGHSSTSEAFFLAGAKTLISSALPINSHLASTFLARLIERIRTYLPARLNNEGPIRWSTFISGMIRRTYYYELVSLLQKELKFDSDKKASLLFSIGMHIDPLSPNWVQETRTEILNQLSITPNDLDKFIERNIQFLECMKYLQLGRPESIMIWADKSDLT